MTLLFSRFYILFSINSENMFLTLIAKNAAIFISLFLGQHFLDETAPSPQQQHFTPQQHQQKLSSQQLQQQQQQLSSQLQQHSSQQLQHQQQLSSQQESQQQQQPTSLGITSIKKTLWDLTANVDGRGGGDSLWSTKRFFFKFVHNARICKEMFQV